MRVKEFRVEGEGVISTFSEFLEFLGHCNLHDCLVLANLQINYSLNSPNLHMITIRCRVCKRFDSLLHFFVMCSILYYDLQVAKRNSVSRTLQTACFNEQINPSAKPSKSALGTN